MDRFGGDQDGLGGAIGGFSKDLDGFGGAMGGFGEDLDGFSGAIRRWKKTEDRTGADLHGHC